MNQSAENTGAPLAKSHRGFPSRVLILLLAGLSLMVPAGACASQAFMAQLPPMLPPSYYACIEGDAKTLQAAYYDPYGHGWLAQVLYDGQFFVLKDVEIIQGMMESKGDDYLWIDRIKCVAVSPEEVSGLKVGQLVDIVGVMRGIPKDPDTAYSLLMEGCYFLPAGSVALPLPGGEVFTPGY